MLLGTQDHFPVSSLRGLLVNLTAFWNGPVGLRGIGGRTEVASSLLTRGGSVWRGLQVAES